jgi:hypothetical protein
MGTRCIQGPGGELDQLIYGKQWEEDPGPWALGVSRARVRSWTSSVMGIIGRRIQAHGHYVYPGPGDELGQLNHGTP